MNTHDFLSSGFFGEFESEVALPVRVRYAVDAEGCVEVTHVSFAGAGREENGGRFLWQHLPLRERKALESAAKEEARRMRE